MADNERIKQVFSSSGGAIITGNLSGWDHDWIIF